MSEFSFDRYGRWAQTKDPLLATGRPPQVRERERLILADVAEKLELNPKDRVLDIGAGIGTLTIPMSFMVAQVTAIDHPDCLARIKLRAPEQKIDTIAGNFFSVDVDRTFTKILAYSTVHYLSSFDEVLAFINKALKHLERHGRLLIGDLPNKDVKWRWENTPEGTNYAIEWNKRQQVAVQTVEEYERLAPFANDLAPDPAIPEIGDAEVLALLSAARRANYHAWILPQPAVLPFGSWREDLLVMRP